MTRSGGNGNRSIESNWVELSTLAAVFASLIAVCVNGCDSDERNHADDHTHHAEMRQESLASRPYIAVSLSDLELHPVAGGRISLPLAIPNLGQQPADTHIKSMIKYSADQLAAIPSLDGVAEQRRLIPAGMSEPITAYSREPITSQEADDIEHGRGWIYLIAQVSYNGHTARSCQEFPIIAAKPAGPAQLGRYSRCTQPQSNYFD